jgi:hypothetical protein
MWVGLLNIRYVLAVLVLVVITITFDTSMVSISTSAGGITSPPFEITFFGGMVVLFALAQKIILQFTNQEYKPKGTIYPLRLKLQVIAKVVSIANYLLLGLLVSVVIMMILMNSYHIMILKFIIFISYGLSSVLLGLLAYQFLSWLIVRHNIVLFFYTMAISAISLNSLITIFFLNNAYVDNPEYIRHFKSLLGVFATPDFILNSIYVGSSVASFILMWIATVLLLKNYSIKLGTTKYWIIVSLPLAYFLSQFQSLFLYSLEDFRLYDPVLFGIVYNLIFAAIKPTGAILFGLAFWLVAQKGTNNQVRTYMVISSFGVILLFTANQPVGLSYAPYPPFGLVTICYMILASYLILIGIYSSALSVATDSALRRSIRKSVGEKANLLDSIGTTQMHQLIEKTVVEQTRNLSSQMEQESGIKSSLDESELRQYIDEVMNEVKAFKRKDDDDK